jgi:tetratricopeptide (TPR) repeat protein
MSTGKRLGSFVLRERVGPSVWLAEKADEETQVAVKLLTRQLPADPAEREAMVREARSGAALYHTSLVPVLEVEEIGDALVLIMERVEGEPLSRKLGGVAAPSVDCYRLTYQLGSVLKYLHSRQIIHGNINSDSVLVTDEGRLLLAGLNLANLLRRGKPTDAFLQKRADLRSVAYMAPEQIARGEADARSDVFSVGTVLYEMATGCLPHTGRSAAEVALSIAQRPPLSPLAINPALPAPLLTTMGRCLFKDPEKRYQDPKAILEAIAEADPLAAEFAASLEKTAAIPRGQNEEARPILFLAEVAGYDTLATGNPELAAASRMQLVLGETVHLFGGRVVDPLGVRLVAELPSVDSAIEAGRKTEFDVRSGQAGLPDLRMLLHAGAYDLQGGEPAGPAVEQAVRTLAELPENQLFISENFVQQGRGSVRLRDAGARAGLKLYTIVPAEPPAIVESEVTDELESSGSLVSEDRPEPAARLRRGARGLLIAAIALLILIAAGVGGVRLWMRSPADSVGTGVPSAIAGVPAGTAVLPQSVFIAPLTVDSENPALVERARAIRLAAIAVLRSYREVRLTDSESPDAVVVTAELRSGTESMEIVTRRDNGEERVSALPDVASGVAALIEAATLDSSSESRPVARPETMNAFAEATLARASGNPQRADASLRKAMAADPSFLPAQLLAMEFFAATGRDADAVAAARQVLALDPANLDAARRVARASLIAGDLRGAFALFGIVLERNPLDAEALNHYARYATSVGDEPRFKAALGRLERLPPMQVAAHEPDLLAAAGRFDAAMRGYYEIEDATAGSASLALKIGRLSVLRHSLPIAEIQLAKLEQLDPLYGYHLLNAYIAAEKRDRAGAVRALETALGASTPGDDSWTAAAEVYTILADSKRTLDSLERAAQRKEPTASYVVANPLFQYLGNEPRYRRLRTTLAQQQEEIRAVLASVQ